MFLGFKAWSAGHAQAVGDDLGGLGLQGQVEKQGAGGFGAGTGRAHQIPLQGGGGPFHRLDADGRGQVVDQREGVVGLDGAFGQRGFFAGLAAGTDRADRAHVELEGAGEGGVGDVAGLGGCAAERAEEKIGRAGGEGESEAQGGGVGDEQDAAQGEAALGRGGGDFAGIADVGDLGGLAHDLGELDFGLAVGGDGCLGLQGIAGGQEGGGGRRRQPEVGQGGAGIEVEQSERLVAGEEGFIDADEGNARIGIGRGGIVLDAQESGEVDLDGIDGLGADAADGDAVEGVPVETGQAVGQGVSHGMG